MELSLYWLSVIMLLIQTACVFKAEPFLRDKKSKIFGCGGHFSPLGGRLEGFEYRGGSQEAATQGPTSDESSSFKSDATQITEAPQSDQPEMYGRISDDEYRLTPEQIAAFHRDGCVTIENVLNENEVADLATVFDMFLMGYIQVPEKDFCDMSKPFGIPPQEWSIVNCMLPTTYYPAWRNNTYERLTRNMAQQLFPENTMVKDYDQLLNKRPGKSDAVFAWHQDMAYWPGPAALGVTTTDTCTFSLAIDDSDEGNGCLRYVAGSGVKKKLRPHRPLIGDTRDEGHALTVQVDMEKEDVRLAPAKRGSITIHDEYVVHGSGGNPCEYRQRRTYVVAYRAKEIVEAERRIGFTHSHNDKINWDTFLDGESHRVATKGNKTNSSVQRELKSEKEDSSGHVEHGVDYSTARISETTSAETLTVSAISSEKTKESDSLKSAAESYVESVKAKSSKARGKDSKADERSNNSAASEEDDDNFSESAKNAENSEIATRQSSMEIMNTSGLSSEPTKAEETDAASLE